MSRQSGNFFKRTCAVIAAALLSLSMAVPAFAADYDDNTAVVQEVQQKLSDSGIDCGTPDGIAGSKTRSAIEKWQSLTGSSEDGIIDTGLLQSMGVSDSGDGIGSTGILTSIPQYSGTPYVSIDNNVPDFTKLTKKSFIKCSDLDSLGRCGTAYANISEDTLPTEKRGSIGSVKPSAWQLVKYDSVDGKYLYNRCHLLGYQLSGLNADERNLITGTRYMNTQGMLPFENMVADYVKETGNHVLYRVTPWYDGDNLLASGVEMEAESVEDKGDGILFHVFCYNVQPEIGIDYSDGDSFDKGVVRTSYSPGASSDSSNSAGTKAVSSDSSDSSVSSSDSDSQKDSQADSITGGAGSGDTMVWISATGSKYHSIPNCGRMNPANATQETESQAISQGYGKCKKCW